MKVTILGDLESHSGSRRTQGAGMKLGTAARACKGKKKGAFRACIKQKMRGGKRKSRRSRR